MAALTIKNVSKSYGTTPAISNVSIEVEDGEFLVLVGPSGCGKSTLLRVVAGLETLNEGAVFLGDRDITSVDPKNRDIAMVFQSYALYPHMTVYENMAFGLQQRKTPKAEIAERVMETARILDLEELVRRKPGQLSGGQRQRVAMGRAIVRNPALYLMDEPLSNLDAKLRVQMRSELKLLRARMGVTTIYVTHDQVEAMTLGDKVAVLKPISGTDDTNLQQVDSPQQLYLRPASLFVAGFIGSPAMNFFYVDIDNHAEGLTARIADTPIGIALPRNSNPSLSALAKYSGHRVVMGIRPEFFSLGDLADEPTVANLQVDILVSELVGPDAYLHFDLPTPDVEIEGEPVGQSADAGRHASRFTARVGSETVPDRLSHARLDIDVSRLHFFDPETSKVVE